MDRQLFHIGQAWNSRFAFKALDFLQISAKIEGTDIHNKRPCKIICYKSNYKGLQNLCVIVCGFIMDESNVKEHI